MSKLSKCCGAEVIHSIKWLGFDYKRTKDGWIEIEYICSQCHKPCKIKEKQSRINPERMDYMEKGLVFGRLVKQSKQDTAHYMSLRR